MLIPFNTICKKYGFIPKGILHIGAHEMEERADYLSLGVNKIIWVDGNLDLVEKCRTSIDESHERMLHALVYSEDDLEFDFRSRTTHNLPRYLNFQNIKSITHRLNSFEALR